jgi:spectinomycin phosphotransferase
MLDDPGLDTDRLRAALADCYGVVAVEIRFLPLGYDFAAAVYRVAAADRPYFLKVRFGPPILPALAVPTALRNRGIGEVLALLPTRDGAFWAPLGDPPSGDRWRGDALLVLYPWIDGRDAMTAGMTPDQWRAFGRALRAVHDSGLAPTFRDRLRTEAFDLPSAADVRRATDLLADGAVNARSLASAAGSGAPAPAPAGSGADAGVVDSPAARRFAAVWRAHAGRIAAALARAHELGRALAARPRQDVLCHGDIHAANVLVGDDGRIHLIDWDGPLLAPRERDLLFVVGSRIARRVLPEEEAAFFAGYGPVAIDPDALRFFRYERLLEDLGAFAREVLLDPAPSEQTRAEATDLVAAFFAPNGDLDAAETVVLPQFRGIDS